MSTYGFGEGDARRIGNSVRVTERFPPKVDLGNTGRDGAAPGVRLLLAKHSATSWATGTTAVVTVFNGSVPGSVASALTVVAYNHYVKFGENTACTNRWVALGHNGYAWIAIDSQSDCGTCVSEASGINFSAFPGYVQTNVQVLSHGDDGCIRWLDTTTCATAAE
jgi:hypothetical protein